MEGLTFGAFLLSVQSFISWFAKRALGIAVLVIAISAVVPLLPDDPLRSDILTIQATFSQWADFINWLIPADFIVTSSLFAVACKMTFYLIKIVMNMLGVNFMSMFTSYEAFGSSVVDNEEEL